MFNVGGGEFLVIAVLALIVLGPQRLPEAARQIGSWMGELRKLSSGFQQELTSAMGEHADPAMNAMKKAALASTNRSPLAKGLTAAVQAVSAQAPAETSETAAAPNTPTVTTTRTTTRAAKQAPAKKAPAKKAPAKQAPAKKAPAKKAPAKKAPAKKAPAKKAPAKEAPAKHAPAKKAAS